MRKVWYLVPPPQVAEQLLQLLHAPTQSTQFVQLGQVPVLQLVLNVAPLGYAQLEPPFAAAVVIE
jgi:hypothetical protein